MHLQMHRAVAAAAPGVGPRRRQRLLDVPDRRPGVHRAQGPAHRLRLRQHLLPLGPAAAVARRGSSRRRRRRRPRVVKRPGLRIAARGGLLQGAQEETVVDEELGYELLVELAGPEGRVAGAGLRV